MSALTDCYATLVTPFGEMGPYYDSLGHRGADYRRSARQSIIAYDDMIVDYVSETGGLGTVMGLRRLNIGGFAGYAHVYAPVARGTRVPKGGILGYVAGSGDTPGSLWSGPHIHTTDSAISASYAANGTRPLNDPAPVIANAIGSSTAGGGTTPIEEDIMTPEQEEKLDKTLWMLGQMKPVLDALNKRLPAFDTTNWAVAERIKPQVADILTDVQNDGV